MWACVALEESECLVWRLESWAPEGDPEEGNLSVRAPQPHREDKHCAGRGGGWAASPSHHTPGSAAPAPCSSYWTGGAKKEQNYSKLKRAGSRK